jgi:hypothetical protein
VTRVGEEDGSPFSKHGFEWMTPNTLTASTITLYCVKCWFETTTMYKEKEIRGGGRYSVPPGIVYPPTNSVLQKRKKDIITQKLEISLTTAFDEDGNIDCHFREK